MREASEQHSSISARRGGVSTAFNLTHSTLEWTQGEEGEEGWKTFILTDRKSWKTKLRSYLWKKCLHKIQIKSLNCSVKQLLYQYSFLFSFYCSYALSCAFLPQRSSLFLALSVVIVVTFRRESYMQLEWSCSCISFHCTVLCCVMTTKLNLENSCATIKLRATLLHTLRIFELHNLMQAS